MRHKAQQLTLLNEGAYQQSMVISGMYLKLLDSENFKGQPGLFVSM